MVLVPFTTDFEAAGGYSPGNLNGQNLWQVPQGSASITNSLAFSGVQSVALAPSLPPTIVTQSFAQLLGQDVIFADFYACPAASTHLDLTTLVDAESSRVAFIKIGPSGEVYAFDGNGVGGGRWVTTGFVAPLNQDGRARDWIRFTLRQDYAAKKWDLYLNGAMVRHDLRFREDTSTFFSLFALQGSQTAAGYFDYFYVGAVNPLFADQARDGMGDAWKSTHGLNPALNERSGDRDGDGLSNIEEFVQGTDPNNPDTDGDGLPDKWEVTHGSNPLANDAASDPGGVGRTILQSYQQGLSPWPAATVQEGLQLWFRADRGISHDAGNRVSDWLDMSGHGLRAVQDAAQAQPIWVESAAGSRPTVDFDGAQTILKTDSVDLLNGSSDLTVIVAVKPRSAQMDYADILDHDHATSPFDGFVLQQNGSLANQYYLGWRNGDGQSWAGDTQGVALAAGQPQVISMVKGGALQKGFLNGVPQMSMAVPESMFSGLNQLGIGGFISSDSERLFNGQISEILIYNRALSDSERQAVEAQLSQKYALDDLDGDGLPDSWERRVLGTTDYGANDDPGNVGRSLLQSYQQGLSPWPAAPVSSGLTAWFRADLGVSKNASDQTSAWTDLSGTGAHALQGTAGAQPLFVASAIGSQPAIRFDGASGTLRTAPTDLLGGSSNFTVFVVAKPGATQNTNADILDYDHGTAPYGGFVLQQNQDALNQYYLGWRNGDGQSWEGTSQTVALTASAPQLISLVKADTIQAGYVNGAQQFSFSVPGLLQNSARPMSIGSYVNGSGRCFSGDVAEVLIYNRALSDSERQTVETYLTARYRLDDVDNDGLPDAWEMQYFGTLNYGPNDDPGGVGRTLLESFQQNLSPLAAATVGSGLSLWLRADFGVTKNASDQVSAWIDSSGSGIVAAQTGPAAQPLFVANAIGSQPALRFDGANSTLRTAGTDLLNGGSNFTVFVVAKPGAAQATCADILDYDHGTAPYGGFVLQQNQDALNQYYLGWRNGDGQSWEGTGQTVSLSAGAPQLLSMVKSDTMQAGFVNGAQQFSLTVPALLQNSARPLSIGSFVNGSGRYFNGDIAEVLIYKRALSDTERQAVESYLTAKYRLDDVDSDGLPDAWEMKNFGTLSYGPNDDPGGVGRTLLQSLQQGLSPWPAATVQDGLRLWLRADLGVTHDEANRVSAWKDLSGNSIDASQADPAARPALVPGAIGSRPALRFDGVGTMMKTGANDLAQGGNDFTIFLMVRPEASQSTYADILDNDHASDPNDGFVIQQNQNAQNQYYFAWRNGDGQSWEGTSQTFALDSSQSQQVAIVKGGETQSVYLNGTPTVSFTVPAAMLSGVRQLGIGGFMHAAGRHFKGDIAEILIYNRALSAAEIQSVQGELTSRYANSDTDGNGLADSWEMEHFGHLGVDPQGDEDGDGLTNLQEFLGGTDPKDYYNGLQPVLTSLVDSSGLPGPQGQVAVRVTRASDGSPMVNAPLTLGVTTGASQIAAYPGGALDSQIAIRTDAEGVANGYLVFSSAAPDTLVATAQNAVLSIPVNPPTRFVPSNGLRMWVKASTGIVADADGRVSRWNDQSGSASDLWDDDLARQPRLVEAALNGQPALRFDGIDDLLRINDFMVNATAGDLFIVCRANDLSSVAALAQFGTGDGTAYVDGLLWNDFGTNATGNHPGPGASLLTKIHLFNASVSADGESIARFNGNEYVHLTGQTVSFPGGALIGGDSYSEYFNGDIAEVILFDRVLSETERAAVSTYLVSKYSIGSDDGGLPTPVLTASAVSPTRVALSWTAADGATATLERKSGDEDYQTLSSGTGDSAFSDGGLNPGQTYTYRVKLSNAAGESAYSDPVAVTLPAADDSAPATISGLRLFLRADAGLVTDDSGAVAQWWDQSPVGNVATQADPALRPQLVANEVNGQPVVRFNGNNQGFTVTDFMQGATEGEIFAVLKCNPGVSGEWSFGGSPDVPGTYYPDIDGRVLDDFGSTERQVTEPPAAGVTNYHVYNVSAAAGQWVSRYNGNVLAEIADNTVGFTSAPTLGYTPARSFNGDLVEVIVYDRVLDESERSAVNAHLAAKYDLQNGGFTPPPTPDLAALAVSPTRVALNWTANAGATATLERKSPEGDFEGVASGIAESSTADAGLNPGQTYTYRVKLTNAAGDSPYSDPVTVTLPPVDASIPTAGLRIWLKADAGLVAGGPVARWFDQSICGNDAVQVETDRQPAVAANQLNGLPVVHFSQDHCSSLDLPNLMTGASRGEAFAVLRKTDRAIVGLWSFGQGGGSRYPENGNWIWDDFATTNAPNTGAPPIDLTQFHLYNVGGDSAHWFQNFNGAQNYVRNDNSVGFRDNPSLGDGQGCTFDGDIAEVVIYDHVLTEGERGSVSAYLVQKYQLPAPNPIRPTLAAYAVSDSKIDLNWSCEGLAGTQPVTTIERRTEEGDFAVVASVSDTGSFTDGGLVGGRTYFYRVRVQGYLGASPYSDTASCATLNAGDIPKGGLRLWLRSTAGVPLVGAVARWADQSELGNDAAQTDTGRQPRIVNSQIAGMPVVHFTQNQGTCLDLPDVMAGATKGEAFAVLRKAPSAVVTGLWSFGPSSGSRYPESTRQILDDFASDGWKNPAYAPSCITSFHVYNVGGDANSWFQNINGTQYCRTTSNTVGFRSNPTIGDGQGCGFDGDLAEVLVYDRVLSVDERAQLLSYFNTKYSLGSQSADATPPSAPTGLVATAVTGSSVLLSWNASTDDVGVTGYEVYLDSVLAGWSPTTSLALAGLQPGRIYLVTIKAKDAAGNLSLPAALSVVTAGSSADMTPPSAPEGLDATNVTASSLTLSWTPSSDNVGVVSYEVYAGAVLVGSTPTNSRAVPNLAPSTDYAFTVKARDAAGNVSLASQSLVVHTAPSGTGLVDSDGDGMPDEWEILYGLNPLVNDANGDLVGDGVSNLMKYKLGRDPRNAAVADDQAVQLVVQNPH